MSLFLHDFIKTNQSISNVLTYLPCVQYSHSAWFLDGRTSTLICIYFCLFASLRAT